MSLLILEDDQIEERLNHPTNIIFKYTDQKGRPLGGTNNHPRRILKPETKAFLGSLARLDSVNTVAKTFNFHQGQISNMKNGTERNHDNVKNLEAQKELDLTKNIRSTVLDKLMVSLGVITEDKLNTTSPVLAASIVEKLASTHEKLSPKTGITLNQANITYFVPKQKEEADYPLLEAEVIESNYSVKK